MRKSGSVPQSWGKLRVIWGGESVSDSERVSEIETKLYKAPMEMIWSISKTLGREWSQAVPKMAEMLEQERPVVVTFAFIFTKKGDEVHVDYGALGAGMDKLLEELDEETRNRLLKEFQLGILRGE